MAHEYGVSTDSVSVRSISKRYTVEELYLSADALRALSQITRYLIVHKNVVLKMSDPLVVSKVFEICEKMTDEKVSDMFTTLKLAMSKPSTDSGSSFVFYVDQHVLASIDTNVHNVVVRDRYGYEKVPMTHT